jgi:hypothetical protein
MRVAKKISFHIIKATAIDFVFLKWSKHISNVVLLSPVKAVWCFYLKYISCKIGIMDLLLWTLWVSQQFNSNSVLFILSICPFYANKSFVLNFPTFAWLVTQIISLCRGWVVTLTSDYIVEAPVCPKLIPDTFPISCSITVLLQCH